MCVRGSVIFSQLLQMKDFLGDEGKTNPLIGQIDFCIPKSTATIRNIFEISPITDDKVPRQKQAQYAFW